MYSFSIAPTGRATCKGKCKSKIEKGELRLGTETEGAGDYTMVSYRKLGCVTKKQFDNMTEKLGSVESVPGFDALSSAMQDEVRAAAEAALPPGKPARSFPRRREEARLLLVRHLRCKLLLHFGNIREQKP